MAVPRPNEEASEYDLAPTRASPVAARANPTSAPPVLNYGGRIPDQPLRADEHTVKNFYMPLWLLGVGAAVEVIGMLLRRQGLLWAMVHLGIEIGVGTLLMFFGILLAARIRDITLGPIHLTLFKLAAISVAPDAALTLLTPALMLIPLGFLIGLVGEFIFYFALLGALFDLDEGDTWYCVWVIFLIRVIVYVSLVWGGLLR
jgi:hypothetical protein